MHQLLAVDGTTAELVEPCTLADLNLKEREHLQQWVIAHPGVLGDDVLIVTEEFDQWASDAGRSAKDRLDVLGLDSSGRLVVCELKRDQDRHAHLQAITYAALVSSFDEERLAAAHAAFLTRRGTTTIYEDALAMLRSHAGGELDPELLGVPRIVLVADTHTDQVVTSAVWLSRFGLDIELREICCFKVGEQAVVTFDQVYPVPGVDALLLAPVRKQTARTVEKAEELAETQKKRKNAVPTIIENGLLEDDTELTIRPGRGATEEMRSLIEDWLEENPELSKVTWRNNKSAPLTWRDETWSPSRLAGQVFLEATGVALPSDPQGTTWFFADDGRSLADIGGVARTTGRDWSDLHELISLIQPGEWASYGDLAAVIGVGPQATGNHVAGPGCPLCPDGAWRLLQKSGVISPKFSWNDPEDDRDPREVLESEGLMFDDSGRADPSSRVGADELTRRRARRRQG